MWKELGIKSSKRNSSEKDFHAVHPVERINDPEMVGIGNGFNNRQPQTSCIGGFRIFIEPGEDPVGIKRIGNSGIFHDQRISLEGNGNGTAFHVMHQGIFEQVGNKDLGKIRSGAGTFARLAPQVKGWYPPGTGPDVGKTRAKAAIWQKPADFRAKALAFESAATKFNAAAKAGDLAAIRAAQGDLGKTCKACHDPSREPEHD